MQVQIQTRQGSEEHLLDSYRVLTASFRRSLQAQNKSPRTIQTYGEALGQFGTFIAASGMPEAVTGLHREHVEAFVAGSVRTQGSSPTDSPSVPLVRYAALTSSINSRHREMNTSRRAANDAVVLSILK